MPSWTSPAIFVTVAFLTAACRERDGPTLPIDVQPGATFSGSHGGCASPTYTISGLITAHGGDLLADAGVEVVSYPYGSGTSTKTGTGGRYSLCGPTASKVGLQIWKDGYATAFRYDLSAKDQTIDVVLQPRLEVPVGGTVTSIIRGDELPGGDDDFGGLCRRTPCKIVDFGYQQCRWANPRAEITLRWNDASSQLALYFPNTSIYLRPPSVPPGTRICCSSPLVATQAFNYDFDRFAIAFEKANGTTPGPDQSQAFELTIRPQTVNKPF